MPKLCGWDLSGINARPTAAVLKGSLKTANGVSGCLRHSFCRQLFNLPQQPAVFAFIQTADIAQLGINGNGRAAALRGEGEILSVAAHGLEVVVAKCDFADFAVDGRGVEIIRPPEFAIGAGDVNRDGNEFPRLRFGAVDGGKHGATAAVAGQLPPTCGGGNDGKGQQRQQSAYVGRIGGVAHDCGGKAKAADDDKGAQNICQRIAAADAADADLGGQADGKFARFGRRDGVRIKGFGEKDLAKTVEHGLAAAFVGFCRQRAD